MNSKANQSERAGHRRLRRPDDGRMLGGVAAGLATFFAVDVTYVRIAFLALSLLGGAGVPLYLAAWVLIPEEDSDTAIADGFFRHAGRHAS